MCERVIVVVLSLFFFLALGLVLVSNIHKRICYISLQSVWCTRVFSRFTVDSLEHTTTRFRGMRCEALPS